MKKQTKEKHHTYYRERETEKLTNEIIQLLPVVHSNFSNKAKPLTEKPNKDIAHFICQ